MNPVLDIAIGGRNGAFDLEAAFTGGKGLTAIFGPSGAGKTTVLRAIAGLWTPERGRITLADRVLFDAENGTNVPTHARQLGAVFQSALLFPHLTVLQNLLYGSRDGDRDLAATCALLDIDHLVDRRPANLSGGEAQRVALGRALLSRPRMLLLDEPMTALDDARRERLLPYLINLREKSDMPIVYVSHRRDEILRLADQVVMMERGKVVETVDVATFEARSA